MGDVHILVVDDELEVREMIRDYLAGNGYAVSAVAGGAEMRRVLSERPANLVILDLRMPGEDGLSLARYLREQGQIGIIMVTASTEVVDRVVGLELGADDYISKPFDPRELLARVRSVLRRTELMSGDHKPVAAMAHEIRMGRCMFNLQSGRLYTLVGEDVPLTSMEFELLKTFLDHPNSWMIVLDLLGVAIAGGMFVVPLYAFLTTTVPKSETARTIAANNIVNSGLMVFATLILTGAVQLGVTVGDSLLIVAVGSIIAAWLGWKLHLACD